MNIGWGRLEGKLLLTSRGSKKIEKKTDMTISTLRRFVEAMGGQLEIRAYFPEGDVRINQFEDLDDKRTAS
jgi:hypothetical protein